MTEIWIGLGVLVVVGLLLLNGQRSLKQADRSVILWKPRGDYTANWSVVIGEPVRGRKEQAARITELESEHPDQVFIAISELVANTISN